jgi:hypothetical protein
MVATDGVGEQFAKDLVSVYRQPGAMDRMRNAAAPAFALGATLQILLKRGRALARIVKSASACSPAPSAKGSGEFAGSIGHLGQVSIEAMPVRLRLPFRRVRIRGHGCAPFPVKAVWG